MTVFLCPLLLLPPSKSSQKFISKLTSSAISVEWATHWLHKVWWSLRWCFVAIRCAVCHSRIQWLRHDPKNCLAMDPQTGCKIREHPKGLRWRTIRWRKVQVDVYRINHSTCWNPTNTAQSKHNMIALWFLEWIIRAILFLFTCTLCI